MASRMRVLSTLLCHPVLALSHLSLLFLPPTLIVLENLLELGKETKGNVTCGCTQCLREAGPFPQDKEIHSGWEEKRMRFGSSRGGRAIHFVEAPRGGGKTQKGDSCIVCLGRWDPGRLHIRHLCPTITGRQERFTSYKEHVDWNGRHLRGNLCR